MEQDLHILRDDMIAFIEGHGLRRLTLMSAKMFPAFPGPPTKTMSMPGRILLNWRKPPA
jgi:hypothetical protein